MLEDESDSAVLLLEQKIMDYFAVHPSAADTADGIAEWWLGSQGVYCSKSDAEVALESLVAKGFVVKTISNSGEPIYTNKFLKH